MSALRVSVIIPTYNEAETIEGVVESIRNCKFSDESFEILISDGLSTDGTLEIIRELESKYVNVFGFINGKKFQVHALNSLIEKCKGKYIVRCDAHAVYPENYIVDLADVLEKYPDVGNAGVPTQNIPGDDTLKALAISRGMNSKVGVGVSHRTNVAKIPLEGRDCDTVLFGSWNSSVFDVVGRFDENFIRGQDYEHNVRVRKCGLRVAQFDGSPVQYKTRENYKKLFNVIKQYASAKPYIYLKHRMIPSIRSVIPLVFYLFLVFGLFFELRLTLTLTSCYLAIVFYVALKAGLTERFNPDLSKLKAKIQYCYYFAGSIFTMHIAHAIGTFIGLVSMFKKVKTINWDGTR